MSYLIFGLLMASTLTYHVTHNVLLKPSLLYDYFRLEIVLLKDGRVALSFLNVTN